MTGTQTANSIRWRRHGLRKLLGMRRRWHVGRLFVISKYIQWICLFSASYLISYHPTNIIFKAINWWRRRSNWIAGIKKAACHTTTTTGKRRIVAAIVMGRRRAHMNRYRQLSLWQWGWWCGCVLGCHSAWTRDAMLLWNKWSCAGIKTRWLKNIKKFEKVTPLKYIFLLEKISFYKVFWWNFCFRKFKFFLAKI